LAPSGRSWRRNQLIRVCHMSSARDDRWLRGCSTPQLPTMSAFATATIVLDPFSTPWYRRLTATSSSDHPELVLTLEELWTLLDTLAAGPLKMGTFPLSDMVIHPPNAFNADSVRVEVLIEDALQVVLTSGELADDDAMLLDSSRSGMSWKSNLPIAIPWTDHLWKAPRPIWCLRALHQWSRLFGHHMAPSTTIVMLGSSDVPTTDATRPVLNAIDVTQRRFTTLDLHFVLRC
jgi:hypothetical protein